MGELDRVRPRGEGFDGSIPGAAVAGSIFNLGDRLETIPNALPLAKSGQMRAIGVTTKERSAAAPDIPTLAESGLPDFDVSAWTGLFVPAGTPAAVIDRLNAATRAIANDSHYVDLVHKMATNVATSSPQEFLRPR